MWRACYKRAMTQLAFYNTLTRRKDPFTPIDAAKVRMYACGPTVYDRPHIGNARSVVVYDVLFRLLRHVYGPEHVLYVRNITDVDDKINAAAKANGEPISDLTARVESWFASDMAALGCLAPTREPHATAHIPQMVAIIEQLLTRGHAYVSQGHVLFRVESYAQYGQLSGRKLENLIAGARVEVESYKQHPGDFVLWKPSEYDDDPSSVFESPWGPGRPGWHIECSAMSQTYLGGHFDIHGGGADLMFPHHENEIAQSRCADPEHNHFANVWVHNGFLTVNGEKMSKSLGNFITVHDLLEQGVHGEVIRLVLLSARYSEPLDWNEKLLADAKLTLDKWYRNITPDHVQESPLVQSFLDALADDLNVPRAFAFMHAPNLSGSELYTMGRLLGFFQHSSEQWFKGASDVDEGVQALIDERIAAKAAKNWGRADEIRKMLAEQGILLEDRPNGTTDWRKA